MVYSNICSNVSLHLIFSFLWLRSRSLLKSRRISGRLYEIRVHPIQSLHCAPSQSTGKVAFILYICMSFWLFDLIILLILSSFRLVVLKRVYSKSRFLLKCTYCSNFWLFSVFRNCSVFFVNTMKVSGVQTMLFCSPLAFILWTKTFFKITSM